MKTIIAGSRTINHLNSLIEALKKCDWEITEIVSGGAKGADNVGERYAIKNNIPWMVFDADWKRWGKRAGMIRNGKMARYADALILLWDGTSRGSKNMLDQARENNLKIIVHIC